MLVCFVLFVTVGALKTVHPLLACLVLLESSPVHELCFVTFRSTIEKILNFEVLSSMKLEKYFHFSFDCGKNRGHTRLYFKLVSELVLFVIVRSPGPCVP